MKKINVKSVMIFTLLIASAMATPAMATAYGNDDETYDFDQAGITGPGDLMQIFGGFGSALSGLGYGGQIIGKVFEVLLLQTLSDFSESEIMPGVFVLSAYIEEEIEPFNKTFDSNDPDYYIPPYNYDQTEVVDAVQGSAYCEVKKEGWATVNITVGAGVTLLIYDQDRSFIIAIKKVIDFVNRLLDKDLGSLSEEEQEELIHDGIETLTWFLIHINDIFTGEELIALNPITWQNMKITPDPSFALTKTWKVTGSDHMIDDGDELLNDTTVSGAEAMLDRWNASAIASKDSYMQWLLRPVNETSLIETRFTAFTFDLIQLWVKNFEIHIDAAAIIDLIGGGGATPTSVADIFRGLDIEFYLFTHHLAGAFLYNDSNDDGQITTSYRNATVGDETLTIDGVPVQVPDGSEITHRIMLGSVEGFTYELPEKEAGSNKISWGLTLNNPTIVPVPVGVDLNSYLGAIHENLQYIHFGFSFEPREVAAGILYAPVKLDQFFAPWNNLTDPHSKNNIEGLDMGIIYLSTMLHFRLNVATIGEDPDDPATLLDPADDYNNETHTLRVGNYLGKAFRDELAFVDIAGPDYLYGAEGTTDSAPASSAIIPLALYEGEVERHDTFLPSEGSDTLAFATDVRLNVSFNVMAYAVCFPMFEDGSGIWHDPTFSVYMVFEVQGFWALILLIAGVGLVGIATILIKKRKDARF